MKRLIAVLALFAAGAALMAGCGRRDPQVDAAPPPRPGAVAEPNMAGQRVLPQNPGPARPGAGGMTRPAPPPPGVR